MNTIQLIGNLTRDPEVSETASGVSVARLTIAVNRPFSSSQERKVDFFNVSAWRTLAENCARYLSKGSKVGVVGYLQNDSYTDKNGDKRFMTKIIANSIEFLSSPRDLSSNNDDGGYNRNSKKGQQMEIIDDDDLPF